MLSRVRITGENRGLPLISNRSWLVLLVTQLLFLPLIALEEYLALGAIVVACLFLFYFFNRLANSIVLLPLFIFMPFEIPESFGLQFSELGVLLLFVSALGTILLTGRALKFELPAAAAIALILTAGILSMINAKYLGSSIKFLLKHIEAYVFVFYIVVNFLHAKSDIRKALLSLSFGGFLAAIFGILRFTFGIEQRVFGLHGGVYGAFIGIAIVCSVSMIAYGRKDAIRHILILMIPIMILALLLSQTRAWTGGTILALLYLVYLQREKLGKLRVAIMMVGLMGIVFLITQSWLPEVGRSASFEQATQRAFHFGLTEAQDRGKYLSSLARLFIWWRGFQIYLQYPILGFGWGNLRFRNMLTGELGSPYESVAGYVDNHYLFVLYETGIFGLLGWLWLIAIIYRNGKQLHALAVDKDWQAISRGILGSLVLLAFGGIFWSLNTSHETTVIVPYLFGLLFASLRTLRQEMTSPVTRTG